MTTVACVWDAKFAGQPRIGNGDAIRERLVVEAGDPGDHDWLGVEELLASRNRTALGAHLLVPPAVGPPVEEREGVRIERDAVRIQPDRIVDADEERLFRERDGSSLCAIGAQGTGLVVARLRREQPGFECHDRRRLLRRR